ncbi:MAG: M1 family metallopeptidase [Bacteroidales bacterium]
MLYTYNTSFAQFSTVENKAKSVYSDTIEATQYDIHLTSIHQTNKTIEGYTTVSLFSKTGPLSVIRLELASLKVDSVFIGDKRTTAFSQVPNQVIIPLPVPIESREKIQVTIYYHGHPFVDPSGWGGFHFSGDYALNLGVGFDAIPHNLGKAWFPCIDDFHDRANYDIYLTTSNNKKAISGGRLIEVHDNGNNTSTWHWRTEYTIPTYLASATIGKYELVADTFNGQQSRVPVTIYCRPSDTAKTAGTFVHLLRILQVFEKYFGPYPFERVGFTGSPGGLGAMEHASNITYPFRAWTGTTDQEWWYAHELSHMWFGDKVTCASAEDMWLNEGWAVWCESLFREDIYGRKAYKDNMRSKLKDVLQSAHITDGGYYALYGIPQTLTYSTTVYQIGGQVAHTLRGYMGDSLFFGGIKAYLNQYAYQYASTQDLEKFLGTYSGMNLGPFFDAWVYQTGFPHFSVDSVTTRKGKNGYDVTVFVRQRLLGRNQYAAYNHLEITFMDKKWHSVTDTLVFSGPAGNKTFHLPFVPVTAMADLDEKISDATTDEAKTITQAGQVEYPQSFCTVIAEKVPDSALVRITNHWIEADTAKVLEPGLQMIGTQYWTVEGIFPKGFSAKAKFAYNNTAGRYPALSVTPGNTPVLLYRPAAGHRWKEINSSTEGSGTLGTITTANLKPGEYAFGARK